jgi:hypothetical protein
LSGADAPFGEPFPIDDGPMDQRMPAVAGGRGQFFVGESDNFPTYDYDIRGRIVAPYPLRIPAFEVTAGPPEATFWWEDWGCGWQYLVETADDLTGQWGPFAGPFRATTFEDATVPEPHIRQRAYRVAAEWGGAPF